MSLCVCFCVCTLSGGMAQASGQGTNRYTWSWGPREACLHRGEERVLIGLAAHGPHTVRCRSGGAGTLHIALGLCPCTLDPRRTIGTGGEPRRGRRRQAGQGRRAAGRGVLVMLVQRDRRRRSQDRGGSSQGDGRARREDNLGRRKKGEMRKREAARRAQGAEGDFPRLSLALPTLTPPYQAA